jgi:hypothetical protein
VVAYGGVVGSTLVRAGTEKPTIGLAAGAGAGVLLLFVALFFDGRALGLSLFLGGGAYVGFLVLDHPGIDPAAPLIAVLLLLTGELAAWSLDERWAIDKNPRFLRRRAVAVGVLALAGLALATLAVALTAAPAAHGLPWTILGAIATVAAAGTAMTLVRR